MKRAGNLIAEITDLNNLYKAFYKAAKGKRKKPEAIVYEKFLDEKIELLQKQIQTTEIDIGNDHYFTIYEPKERLICAASFSERVLHHALMNICHIYFENQLISESYATRIGKGTYKAIEKAKYFSKQYKYYLKLDIRKYFDSISHLILYNKLKTIFKDPILLEIFREIIESYHSTQGKGLPIGNLTSQYFANFYLAEFDRFIKQTYQIKPYVRYMDDFILWANSPEELNNLLILITNYLEQNLDLSLKIGYINTTTHGLNFLSYRVFNNRIELQQKAKKRFIKKSKDYENKLQNGIFTQSDYQRHALPLISFTEKASAKGFRKKVFGYKK